LHAGRIDAHSHFEVRRGHGRKVLRYVLLRVRVSLPTELCVDGGDLVGDRGAVVVAIEGGATNVGAVMGKVMAQYKGRAEGGTINTIVREELAARLARPS